MNSYRRYIGAFVTKALKHHCKPKQITDDFAQRVSWSIRVPTVQTNLNKKNTDVDKTQYNIPVHLKYQVLQRCNLIPDGVRVAEWAKGVAEDIEKELDSNRCYTDEKAIVIEVDSQKFTKEILTDIATAKCLRTLCSDLKEYEDDYHSAVNREKKAIQNIVVDFSSPNIAKQFHPGHLRSTLLGNIICNINEFMGHKVTRINYLGDWGTQFGYIVVGLEKYYSEEEFNKSPILHYYNVYVKANKDAKNEGFEDLTQTNTHRKAMEFFRKMEEGSEKELEIWKKCREASIKEYDNTYKELGVKFDVYDGESLHHQKALEVVEEFRKSGLLHTDSETGVAYVEVFVDNKPNKVTLLKSSGSTLYITRDIAAALDRNEKYNFDKLLYVVENGQGIHFTNLKLLLALLSPTVFGDPDSLPGSAPVKDIRHVKFGRVQGVTSRYGSSVLLKDMIQFVKKKMKEKVLTAKTTKIPLDNEELVDKVALQLAISAIVIQEVMELSRKNFKFSWDRVLSAKGDTGLKLQYAHARLCSIIRTSNYSLDSLKVDNLEFDLTSVTKKEVESLTIGDPSPITISKSGLNVKANSASSDCDSSTDFESFCLKQMEFLVEKCDFSILCESQALNLVQTLAKFDEAVYMSYSLLEPHHLVHFLHNLSNHTNKAVKVLRVVGECEETALTRLLLFHCSRRVLADGLRLLGIVPLDRM